MSEKPEPTKPQGHIPHQIRISPRFSVYNGTVPKPAPSQGKDEPPPKQRKSKV